MSADPAFWPPCPVCGAAWEATERRRLLGPLFIGTKGCRYLRPRLLAVVTAVWDGPLELGEITRRLGYSGAGATKRTLKAVNDADAELSVIGWHLRRTAPRQHTYGIMEDLSA